MADELPTFQKARPTVTVPDIPDLPLVPGTVNHQWSPTGTGAVTDGANWESGASPFSGGTLDNKGNVVINTGSATVSSMNVAGGSKLFLSTGMTASGNSYVSSNSALNLSAGTLAFGRIDVRNAGVLNVSGGLDTTKITTTSYFIIGSNDSGSGSAFARMNMTGGTIDAGSQQVFFGWKNHAQAVQTGGLVKTTSNVLVGSDDSAKGEYYMTGTGAKMEAGELRLGFHTQTDGLVYASAGTIDATTTNVGAGGKGTLIMTGNSGASLTGTTFNVGNYVNSNYKNADGYVFLDGNASISATDIYIGRNQKGTFYQDGGTATVKKCKSGTIPVRTARW